jgi:hypothetical protein
MVQLIATPATYEGKLIQTVGVLRISETRTNGTLYLTTEDAVRGTVLNGIHLVFQGLEMDDDKVWKLDLERVVVRGVFHGVDRKNPTLERGAITNITHLYSVH